MLQHISHGSKAAVENDISRFAQRLVFHVEQIALDHLVADDGSNQRKTVTFRKDQKRPAGKRPLKFLLDGNEIFTFALADQRGS
ncbi:Uncharacterised protein [Mycobacterium tuberculosis]|nr:Uncharacterised protein [Mycobacterium tuberculosis]